MRQQAKSFSVALAPQWVRSFCEGLGLHHVSIVAHSMGGLIALSLTAQWPEMVERLVLAAPAVGMSQRPVLSFAVPMLTSTFRGSFAYLPTLVADSMRCGPFIVWRAGRELLASNIEEQLGSIHAPTLLIWGAQDPLVPPSLGPAVRQAIAGSELRILDKAGHVVMFDRAEAFNDAALNFLGGNSERSGKGATLDVESRDPDKSSGRETR